MNSLAMSGGMWIALGVGAVLASVVLSIMYGYSKAVFAAYMASFEVK